MDSIIARNAAKHATFESLTMNAQPDGMVHVECKFDGDSRLIAGAATIVVHVARRAGLADQAASEIAVATSKTCDAVLQATGGSRTIRLAADELPDSLQVTIETVADAATAGLLSIEQSRHLADQVRKAVESLADGTAVELHEGFPRVSLVKKCGAARRPFAV